MEIILKRESHRLTTGKIETKLLLQNRIHINFEHLTALHAESLAVRIYYGTVKRRPACRASVSFLHNHIDFSSPLR